MFEFVHHHEIALMVLMCGLVGVIVWHYEKWRDRKAILESHRFTWQCVRWGGGASVWTPSMNEEEALRFVKDLGAVAWVDREHHKIFFRG